MALPALGALFAQLARAAIPTLGRGVAAESAIGTGARTAAGRAAAGGSTAAGGRQFASRSIVEVRQANVARPPAAAAAVQRANVGPQTARPVPPPPAVAPSAPPTKVLSPPAVAPPTQPPRQLARPVPVPPQTAPARNVAGGALAQGLQKIVGQIGGALRGLTGQTTRGQSQTATSVSQSVGGMAQSVARGQQQAGASLSNGLKNTGEAIQGSLKEGFREIAKKLDLTPLLQQRGQPDRQRQAEIANLRQQIAGHGSMMGTSLAPQELQAKLADLEALEAKDEAAREEANRQIKEAAKKLSMAMVGSAAAMVALPAIGKRFGEALLAANEGLKYFNGQIATAYARLDLVNLQLKFQEGRARAATVTGLADAFGELRQEISPIANDLANVKNLIGIGVVKSLTGLVRIANYAMEYIPHLKAARVALDKIANIIGGQGARGDFITFMEDVASGRFIPPTAAQIQQQQRAAQRQRQQAARQNPP